MRDAIQSSIGPATEPTNELLIEARPIAGTAPVQVVDARSYIARSLGITGLLGVALIHLLDSGSQLEGMPYVFWLYVALMIGSVVVSATLLHVESRLAWVAAGLLAGLTILGFVLSRTVGLPFYSADIGNWGEPLGMASLFVEGCVVALSIYRLALLQPRRELRSRGGYRAG